MKDFAANIEVALTRLTKIFPAAENAVGFELSHDGQSGFRLPAFYAVSSHANGHWIGISPNLAVGNLLRQNGITHVEEYIRIKEAS